MIRSHYFVLGTIALIGLLAWSTLLHSQVAITSSAKSAAAVGRFAAMDSPEHQEIPSSDGNIYVKQHGAWWSDWDNSVEIAGGGVNSMAHQADVCVTTVDPWTSVAVTLSDGGGHDVDSKLVIAGHTLHPGGTWTVTTDASGHCYGILTSGDLLNSATVSDAYGEATVTFAWDNYDGTDQWILDQPYITPGGTSDVWLKLAHNYIPINGHQINFYVERVDYSDDDGTDTALDTLETPDNPEDSNPKHHVSYWATFDPDYDTTTADGWVHVTIHFADIDGASYIGFKAYDMTIRKN